MIATTIERSTRLGRVRGIERLGVETYRGLRYAEPVERFRPAVLARSAWNGTYDATTFRAMAYQQLHPAVGAAVFGPMPAGEFSEDCLFLNIHTPRAAFAKPRPVIVFIHGGSLSIGSANFYDGTALARGADAVVVCINYRLGVFAAFDLDWLGTERDGGGQHWLGDQITALTWIRDNIADYGGDPGLVTVIGESAGAVSAGALCLAPKAAGLLHRAVACSTAWLIDAPSIDVVGVIARRRKCRRDQAVEYLRSAAAADLIPIQAAVPVPVSNTPLLPGRPEELLRARGASAVPLIAGYAAHEGLVFSLIVREATRLPPPLLQLVNHLGAKAVAGHPAKGKANVPSYLKRLKAATGNIGFGSRFNDLIWTDVFRRGAMDYCEQTSVAGSRGYLYVLDLPMRFAGRRIPSSHGIDLPLTFNVWDDPEHSVPDFIDHPNAASLGRRWVAMLGYFARTGEPGQALGDWLAYEPGRRSSLRVDGDGFRVEQDVDQIFRRRVWL